MRNRGTSHHDSTPSSESRFRSSSFELPRQVSTRTGFVFVEQTFDPQPSGYDSPGEYKRSSPPSAGSLTDLLMEWQSHRIDHNARSTSDVDDVSMDGDMTPSSRTGRSGDGVPASNDHEESSRTSPPLTAQSPPQTVKRSRYLRETDRRNIIRRIDRGEKQVELAKEFGVTRAAICHINKNRTVILARSTRGDVHGAARHPKRSLHAAASKQQPRRQEVAASSDRSSTPPRVYEVQSSALAIHLTAMRSTETSARQFRVFADRAFRVVLEEALASAPTSRVKVVTAQGDSWEVVVPDHPTSVMVMSESGFPMLEAFRKIQPDSPTGFITLDREPAAVAEGAAPHVSPRRLQVPLDMRDHRIFLLEATCTSGAEAAVAIQALLDVGVGESAVFVVALAITAGAVVHIYERFPRVHVVAGAVEPVASAMTSLGDFQQRYFNICQHGSG